MFKDKLIRKEAAGLKIAYLVPNLGDAAAIRRFSMFVAGGARVAVAGFKRQGQAEPSYDGVDTICLGVSFDGRMLQRALLVAKATLKLGYIEHMIRDADIIVARNLEMLALAVLAKKRFRRDIPVVYECLDIHRLMLSRSAAGRALRTIEDALLAQTAALIVSSPAFVENYFGAISRGAPPCILVENRLLELHPDVVKAPTSERPAGPPWRIGWFGILRCRKSLEFLVDFAKRRPELVEVVIRGRPSEAIPDIHETLAGMQNVTFHGPYTATDLAKLYTDVHFSWAIDFYEEGQNSDWLLPNRLYEGCSFNSVPIAMKAVETGRWLDHRGLGLTISNLDDLDGMLDAMTPERFNELEQDIQHMPRSAFVATREDCIDLVEKLAALLPATEARQTEHDRRPQRLM